MKCDKMLAPEEITVFTVPASGGKTFVICAACLKEAYYTGDRADGDHYFCSYCRCWQVSVKET